VSDFCDLGTVGNNWRSSASIACRGVDDVCVSNDIALGNSSVVGEAAATALANCPEPPDRVYLVETDGRPWYLYRLKEGADIYPSARLHDYNTIEI